MAHIKCRKSNTEIYTNICSLEKSGEFKKSLLLLKIRRIHRILALYKKSGGFTESLHFTKNQADLQNPCALQKVRRIYKIPAAYRENRRTIESLRVLKSPRLVKNQRDWKSWWPANSLGSVESPAADFLLAWLKSSRSDPRRCVVSLMQSPSEETAQAALLLWADSTGCLHRPAMPKFTRQPKTRRPLEFSLIPAKSQKS